MNIQDHTNHPSKGPKVSSSPDIQTLIRGINTAHEKGALFFLAAQLAPSLEGHFKKNGPPTDVELEELIMQVAKTMMSR